MRKTSLVLFVILCMILPVGCKMIKRPEEDPYARMLVDRLIRSNSGLNQFKGFANIRLNSEGQVRSGRIAFAGVKPNKMRIELLNTIGTPLISLAGDGENITILDQSSQKHYHLRQSRTALKSVIQFPIGIEDLQCLLTGGLPIQTNTFASLERKNDQEAIILLKNRWHYKVARLKIDSVSRQIRSMLIFDQEGNEQYRIHWQKWKQAGDYTIPSKLFFESFSDHRLSMVVDRFWPDVQVEPSMFVLDLPGH